MQDKIVLMEDGNFERQYTPTSEIINRSDIEERLKSYKSQAIEAIQRYNKYIEEISKYRNVDPTLATEVLTEPLPDLNVQVSTDLPAPTNPTESNG